MPPCGGRRQAIMCCGTALTACVVSIGILGTAAALQAIPYGEYATCSKHVYGSPVHNAEYGNHGRRLSGRAMAEPATGLRAQPMELTAATFNDYMESVPDHAFVLLELYASWCPHCRAFKPTYDKIGAFFNGVPAPSGPRIVVARVDCAETDNNAKVCNSFKIRGYPTIVFGSPTVIRERHPELVNPRNIPGILKWIAGKTAVYALLASFIHRPHLHFPVRYSVSVHSGFGPATRLASHRLLRSPPIRRKRLSITISA